MAKLYFLKRFFFYFRERRREQWGGAEGEGETISDRLCTECSV